MTACGSLQIRQASAGGALARLCVLPKTCMAFLLPNHSAAMSCEQRHGHWQAARNRLGTSRAAGLCIMGCSLASVVLLELRVGVAAASRYVASWTQ